MLRGHRYDVGVPLFVSSGRFCGGSGRIPGTMTSSDARMWIEYRMTNSATGHQRKYRGFAAQYEGTKTFSSGWRRRYRRVEQRCRGWVFFLHDLAFLVSFGFLGIFLAKMRRKPAVPQEPRF